MKMLANLFLFFSLMPFISPMPTATDVQLPAFVCGFLIILSDSLRGKLRLDWVDLTFVSVAVWSFCYVLPGGSFELRQRTGLLLAFIIYYVAKKHAAQFSPRTVYLAIAVNFAGAVAHWWSPERFAVVALPVIRTLKEIALSRGASGFSAEPSFLAAMAVVQGLIAFYYYRIGRIGGRGLVVGWAMCLTMVLVSKSATGFLYLLMVCAIWAGYFVFRGLRPSVWVGTLLLITTVFFLMTGPLATSRGGVVLVSLWENPYRVIADAAVQERVLSLFLGAVALPDYPFGAGGGTYSRVALDMARLYNAHRIFPSVHQEIIGGILSSMGLYIAELGITFILFLGIVFWRSLRLDPLHLAFGALALLFITLTFSITCPLIWLPLGLAARPQGLRAHSSIAHA